jgi:hypothetical protein
VWSIPNKEGGAASSTSLFGNSSATAQPSSGGLFGSNTTNGTPLFGDTSKPLFGGTGLFGSSSEVKTGSLFGAAPVGGSLFGSKPTGSLFDSKNSLFGNQQTNIFAKKENNENDAAD